MHISDSCPIDILKTVGGVFRTIGVLFWQPHTHPPAYNFHHFNNQICPLENFVVPKLTTLNSQWTEIEMKWVQQMNKEISFGVLKKIIELVEVLLGKKYNTNGITFGSFRIPRS